MKKIALLLLTCLLPLASGCAGTQAASSAPSAASSGGTSSVQGTASAGSAPSSQPSSPAGSGASSSKGTSSSSDTHVVTPAQTASSSPASSSPAESSLVTVTIPEGYTLAKIASKLETSGVCGKSDFLKAAQSGDFSAHPLVKAMPSSSKRAYKLEGYLYPDTYQFYKKSAPKDILNKMLSNADGRIGSRYQYSGMTTDEVVTLASIIQKEADNQNDMKLISAVFHNRLKQGMKIQADPTVTYCTYVLLSPNGPFADAYKYYYNTYRCAALPAGAICNPGADALNAAANPAQSDYLYFITSGGKYYYQKTLDEHTAKMKELGMT